MAHSDILSQPDRGLALDRTQTEALLALFSECDDLREFGREVIQSVVNALMDSQAQEASSASLLRTGVLASTSPSRSIRQAQCDDLPTSRPSTAAGLVDGAFTVVSFTVVVRPDGLPLGTHITSRGTCPALSYQPSGAARPAPAAPNGPSRGQGRSAVRGRPVGGPFWARLNRSPRRSRADNFDCNGRS